MQREQRAGRPLAARTLHAAGRECFRSQRGWHLRQSPSRTPSCRASAAGPALWLPRGPGSRVLRAAWMSCRCLSLWPPLSSCESAKAVSSAGDCWDDALWEILHAQWLRLSGRPLRMAVPAAAQRPIAGYASTAMPNLANAGLLQGLHPRTPRGPAPWLKAVQVVLTRSAPEAGMTQQLSMRPNVERSSVSDTRTRQPRISSSVACMCIRLQPPLPA